MSLLVLLEIEAKDGHVEEMIDVLARSLVDTRAVRGARASPSIATRRSRTRCSSSSAGRPARTRGLPRVRDGVPVDPADGRPPTMGPLVAGEAGRSATSNVDA